ncbi:hypothetical protein [Jatrophihabitans fulvus]
MGNKNRGGNRTAAQQKAAQRRAAKRKGAKQKAKQREATLRERAAPTTPPRTSLGQNIDRRVEDRSAVESMLRSESLDTLLPLLEAASVSPSASHRLASIAVVFEAAMKRSSDEADAVSAADLQSLISRARRADPSVESMEDWIPLDLRLEVDVPWFGELYAIAPGGLERPVAMVDQYQLLADVIDPVLVPHLGFGLRDVGELILRRVDEVVRAARAAWEIEELPDVGDPATLSDAEVAAVGSIDGHASAYDIADDTASRCTFPERAHAALEALCVPSSRLSASGNVLGAPATFGAVLGVERGEQRVFLPAGLLVEGFLAIGVRLAAEAVSVDPRVTNKFWAAVSNRIGHRLRGTATRLMGPADVGADRLIHSLLMFGDRKVVALDVVPGLTRSDLGAHMPAEGDDPLDKVVPGATLTAGGKEFEIPSDAVVARGRVLAVPEGMGGIGGRDVPLMTLADLEWIIHRSHESPDDLWAFLLDLERPEPFRSFGWDMIDRWEVWRPQRSFLQSGTAPTFMMFAPHAAAVEWEEAARATPVERALHRLGMREIRSWPARMTDEPGVADLLDLTCDEAWTVLAHPFPVAIRRTDLSGSRENSDALWHVATSIAWKFKHCAEELAAAASVSDVQTLSIRFRRVEGEDPHGAAADGGVDIAATIANVLRAAGGDSPDQLTIEWDDRLPGLLVADAGAGESRLGELIAEKLAPNVREAVREAWNSAPPGLRMDGYTVRQRISELPDPDQPSLVARASMLRELAEHVAAAGFTPGLLLGAEARDFESKLVFPWLLRRLHQHLANLDPDALVAHGLAQLERAHHQRWMEDRKLSWMLGFPQGPAEGVADDRDEAAKATRTISLLLEEVLAHPPAGTARTDSLTWEQALATAELCVESCMRSSALHYRLQDASINVSDTYEINVEYSQDPTDVDIDAYQRERALATRPEAVPIVTPNDKSTIAESPESGGTESGAVESGDTESGFVESGDTDSEVPKTIIERLPAMARIDAELRSGLGFGIDAMMGVLNVGAQWADAAPESATLTDAAAVVAECVELVVGNAGAAEYTAALNWLTLRGSDLIAQAATTGGVIAHWETDRRAKRLLTSPFVETPHGLWVLPWACEMATRVAVNYLHDGRLPWPNNALPVPVVKALDAYRKVRNRQLEIDSEAQLKEYGFTVRGSVKKPKVIGLKTLSGEIDVLCIDPGRSRIWVIEAKDPYVAFSPAQIRRLIDDFHEPKGYVDKLLKKVEDIEANAPTVSATLGVSEPERSWEVIGLMVTRHVEAAAFAVDPRVAFCTIDTLVEAVDRDELPDLGWFESALAAGT